MKLFEKIENEMDAYWLGYLMADGYNHISGKMIQFTQAEQDKDVVYALRDYIGKGSITITNPRSVDSQALYMLSVYSKELSENLTKLGCINNKSLTLKMPAIADDLLWHFIRGYFDGDGCIYSKMREADNTLIIESPIVSSDDFADGFMDILKKHDINYYKQRLGKNKVSTTVKITGVTSNCKFYDLIYNNCSIKNERKFSKFIEFVERLLSYQKKTNNKKVNACKEMMRKYINLDQ